MSTPSRADPIATQLFGKLRRELLSLLFRNADGSFYLRELARLTGASPGAVQREVALLTRAGLLERSRRGRQVFYQANRTTPIFSELQGLLEKTMGTVDLLRSALAPLADRIEAAVLFGSTAKGSAGPRSDVDVLVVGSAEFSEVADALAAVEKRLGREINPVVYSHQEFRRRVAERGHFVESVLKGPKTSLIGELPGDSRRLARQRVAKAPRNVTARDRGAVRGRRPRA